MKTWQKHLSAREKGTATVWSRKKISGVNKKKSLKEFQNILLKKVQVLVTDVNDVA